MFTIYVLKSLKNGKRYVGYTSKTASERLQEHVNGSNRWTRQNGPFNIIHTEVYASKTEAIKRETFLKSGHGREWLNNTLRG